jgi:hypothetical protein
MSEDQLYTRGRATASRLLGKFKQGTIIYTHPGEPTGPINAPVPGTPANYTLNATASGVSAKYIRPGYIEASDTMLVAAVFERAPTLSGTLSIDGVVKQMISIQPVPAAGEPVAWRIFVKG